MKVQVEKITPVLGGLVSGVDLGQPLSKDQHAEIEQALHEHQVLFFRDQKITEDQHRDFGALFGPLHIHPIYPRSDTAPEVMILDTALNDLRDNAVWHTDVSFEVTPPLGSILVARKLPPVGGDTLWSSATAAYEGLSEPLKQMLDGMKATHDIAKSFPAERFGADEASRERLDQIKRANRPFSHPVIRTHPATGKKAIYVNEAFTTRIEGLDAAASESLLALLYRQIGLPEYSLRWKWRVGDVAMWDNRITQHYAVDDYRPQHRIMHRVTIIGERPV